MIILVKVTPYFNVVGTGTGKKEIPLIISHCSNSSLKSNL